MFFPHSLVVCMVAPFSFTFPRCTGIQLPRGFYCGVASQSSRSENELFLRWSQCFTTCPSFLVCFGHAENWDSSSFVTF